MRKSTLVLGVALLVLMGSGLGFASTSVTEPLANVAEGGTTGDAPSEIFRDTPRQVLEIDSCTVITEPGHYELTADLNPVVQLPVSGEFACLEIRSSDVSLAGNGHTISGPGFGDGIRIGPERIDRQTLDNITVQRVTTREWEIGIGAHWSVDNLTIADVIATQNNGGISLTGVDRPVLRNVSAIGNGEPNDPGDGIGFFEVSHIDARDILVAANNKNGIALYQDVYDGKFVDVTAVRNGGSTDWTGGLYFSTDARRNIVRNAVVNDNDGAGVRFSDSGDNVIQRARIEGNTGSGIHAENADEDRLQHVLVRDNGRVAIRGGDGTLSARSLHVGERARLRFVGEPVSLARVDTATLPAPPSGTPSAEAINVTGIDQRVILSFECFDPSAVETGVELWRFHEDEWTPVENVQTDVVGGELTATLTEDGMVVPVFTGDEPPGPVGEPSVFEILSTDEDGDFGYEFIVDGTVEKTMTDDIAADSGDRIRRNDDGTVTVHGSTGSASGDAFHVTGTITDFRLRYGEPNFVLELDGEDVTDELAGDIVPPEPSTLAIYATTEGEDFTYEFTVDGTAEGTMTEDVAADSSDEVIRNDDGTVTIRGSTGDLSGDAFTVRGEILSFRTSAAPGEYRIERDGEDVTDELGE